MASDDFVAKLRRWIEQAGGIWPKQLDERRIYEELGHLYARQSVLDRIANLIRAHGGRLEMVHEEIAERIGSSRETVTRMLLDRTHFARVLTGKGHSSRHPRWAYGLVSDPPQDLRACSDCRTSATVALCSSCRDQREKGIHKACRDRERKKARPHLTAFNRPQRWAHERRSKKEPACELPA